MRQGWGRWTVLVVTIGLTAGLVAACGDDGTDVAVECESGDTVVRTGDNYYEPQELEVSAGTTVCWENVGRIQHNVVPDEGDEFGISSFNPGNTYRYTFDEPGEYPYYCSFHGAPGRGQYGTVVVT